MLDEILSIVDEVDQVIGQAHRGDIHQQGLMHRSVHLLILNSAGEVLLQKRSMLKDCCPGYWDSSAAGHVEAGESYDDCVMREVTEELGIVLKQLPERLCKLSPSVDNGMEFCQAYQVVHEGPFVAEEAEVDELRWFSRLELNEWSMQDGALLTDSLQMLLAQLD